MKIAFRKISSNWQDVNLKMSFAPEVALSTIAENKKASMQENFKNTTEINLKGRIKKLDSRIFRLESRIFGQLALICAKSGEGFIKDINQELNLYFSDGTYRKGEGDIDALDVIEFFDGFLDMDEVLRGEVMSIQMDYHTKGE